MSNIQTVPPKASILTKFSERFNVEPTKMLETLKATAFKGNVSNEQMIALLIVADQYQLNPFTKEIYAFPDKNNGIVPVVGVDGWSRIINEHPQFDGMSFEMASDASECTCTIYRKDRAHPIQVTEYMVECKRANVGPWMSHPRRMLRHKTMIQASRLAFGFVGVYDQDEAERIIEKDITPPGSLTEPQAVPKSTGNKLRDAIVKKPKPTVIDATTGEITGGQDEQHDDQQGQPPAWEPSAEELEAIRARELAEASK
jgi:phage recombination protein Bet